MLGPLVVAAVAMENDAPLRKLDVKDSKKLTPTKRQTLAPQIRAIATRVETRVITPDELNRRMPRQNLNEIEVDAYAELLRRIRPTNAILDACDVNAARFGHNVAQQLDDACEIRAEHEADVNHPIVAAASIIAKVERDRIIHELAQTHGEIGSGYASDIRTQKWLAAYVARHNTLPPIARHEWETSRRLLAKNHTLLEF